MPNAPTLGFLLIAASATAVQSQSLSGFRPDSLSPFATAKAETLLRDRLACLGCHRLGDDGGVIGPDLTTVGARRSPSFIYAMITNPAGTWPGTGMPKTPMPVSWGRLVASYLAGKAEAAGAAGTTEAAGTADAATATTRLENIADSAALYARACAACHGERGAGDGFNAPHLPVRPTAHADSAYMSTRPDDTLFDGIYAGGFILNKSHRMPAFGLTFTREQIRGLVRYLRELCRCQGPVWSQQ